MPNGNQIEIDIRANASQATQAVAQLTQDVTRLKQQMAAPGAPGSGVLTPLPAGLGGPSTTPLLDAATEAAKRNAGALRQVTGATNELSEATTRGGINMGAMIERMATRLVVFEAIRLAIQGVKWAFDEFSKNEQVRIQFDALSTSVEHLEARFNMLKESAAKALMPIDQAEKLREALIDLGATEDQTVWLTRELGQWSHVLGIESTRLAEALGHVAQGQGSLQEMRLVTRMMGDQREAGIQLINTYQGLERAQKALEAENKTVAQSMEAIVRATEQMGEQVNRTRSRSEEFLKQTGILAQISPQLARGAAGFPVTFTPPPGMTQGALKKLDQMVLDYIGQYQAGLTALGKQTGYRPPIAAMFQAYTAQGVSLATPALSPDYILRVGREAQQDQLRQLREGDQADREHRAFMAEQAAINTQAAKAQIATLPQAVGAPPAAVWDAWKGSLEGLQAQAKENTNEMVKAMWDSTKPLAAAMDRAAAANENVYNLLSGSGGT